MKRREPKELYHLSIEEVNALTKILQNFISAAVLEFPGSRGISPLDTHRCDKKIGCLLVYYQQDGANESLWSLSRTHMVAQQNYATRHPERLGVVSAILIL